MIAALPTAGSATRWSTEQTDTMRPIQHGCGLCDPSFLPSTNLC